MPREDEKQFLLLAKSVKRAALATLIHQVLMSTYLGNCWVCLTLESWLKGNFASTLQLLMAFPCRTYADH